MKTLEEKTDRYWRLSCSRNGRPGEMYQLTVEMALYLLGDLLNQLSPHRPLARLTFELQCTIVTGEKPRSRSA